MNKEYLFNILPFISFLALIFGTKKKRTKADVIFGVILFLSTLVENIGYNWAKLFDGKNLVLYNMFSIFYYLLLFEVYRCLLEDKNKNLKVNICVLYALIIFGYNCYTKNIINEHFDTLIMFLNLPFLYLVILYLIQLLHSDKVLKIASVRYFWVSLGIMIFLIPYSLISLTLIYLVQYNYESRENATLLLNIIMHICFIKAFLWTKEN